MRGIWVAAAAALALAGLAACGNRNFEKPDGTFDRDGYRRWMVPACIAGVMMGESDLSRDERNQLCTCMIERILSTNNDAQMREMTHDRDLARRKQQAAVRQCGGVMEGEGDGEPVFDPQTMRWVNPDGTPAGPPQESRHYFDPATRQIVDANGRPIPSTPPPPPPPPPGQVAAGGVPIAVPGKAIVRNRSGRAIQCGAATGALARLDNGVDFDVDPGRVRCAPPVDPSLFDIQAGRTYDLVAGNSGQVIYRDVTPAR